MRLCTHCRVEKEELEFNRKSKTKATGTCRDCNKLSSSKYYRENRNKLLKDSKIYRQKNKEIVAARDKAKYFNNKEYINKRQAKYYHKHKDTIIINNTIWKNNNRSKVSFYRKRYREKNPEKVRAKDLVYKALKRGELKKEPCLACQVQDKKINNNNIEGHHTDYSRPLNVIWLCKTHHSEVHRKHKLMNNNNL